MHLVGGECVLWGGGVGGWWLRSTRTRLLKRMRAVSQRRPPRSPTVLESWGRYQAELEELHAQEIQAMVFAVHSSSSIAKITMMALLTMRSM